ncbi:hypothetical protein ACFT8W_20765 [Streptomyces hygroscopicus]|uniref:hypothetical protein n=1 Tax=Streptomyces hygroscopicus TaxID=1912 RepID=UPI00362EC7D8
MLAASWEIFDVTGRLADSLVWADGCDELQALATAQSCVAGRSLLPLPEDGHPREMPQLPSEAEALAPYVTLLRSTHAVLSRLADESEAQQVRQAADHAASAAETLAAIRGH